MAESTNHLTFLRTALDRITRTPPRIIASPITQPRRAAVAIIIHITPAATYNLEKHNTEHIPNSLEDLFSQPWVNEEGSSAEVLLIKRRSPPSVSQPNHQREEHAAFPGGKTLPDDEDGKYTAMRETWEEIGIDLADRDWLYVGQLDDREITTSLGKRLLMVLSPYVFVRTVPHPVRPSPPVPPTPDEDDTPPPPSPPAPTLYSVPFISLLRPSPTWSFVTIDLSSRLAPVPKAAGFLTRFFGTSQSQKSRRRGVASIFSSPATPSRSLNGTSLTTGAALATGMDRASFWVWFLRWLMKFAVRTLIVGDMKFSALVLSGRVIEYDHHSADETPAAPKVENIKLWGLTLGMVLDFLSNIGPESYSSLEKNTGDSGAGSVRPTRSVATRRPSRISRLSGWNRVIRPPTSEDSNAWNSTALWTPSMACVFPRFSIPDVNFWIWVFGKRYREIVRGWEASVQNPSVHDQRINWSGQALAAFYAAVRKALVVVIILRVIGILVALGLWAWWYWKRT